jgi:hypothetical protein
VDLLLVIESLLTTFEEVDQKLWPVELVASFATFFLMQYSYALPRPFTMYSELPIVPLFTTIAECKTRA